MAAMTASPPTISPPAATAATSAPNLPPLITSGVTPRRTSSQRPASYASRRVSAYSSTSRASHQLDSRPSSHVFPAFHSSLSYTLVRDFAYSINHPMHYGPPPTRSGMSTPASESRRLSDPVMSTWDDNRGPWSATLPWMDESNVENRDQLPAMTFSDGGPPYSEDEDLHSPIVTTSRHKKHKSSSTLERGRSPGDARYGRGTLLTSGAYREADGPGDAVETSPFVPQHRDSNFAKPLQRQAPSYGGDELVSDLSEAEDDDARFSKDYSFTIASPDEAMHGKAVALFDFESEHQNELPLKEGQIVLVSYRHGQGWLVAEDPRTGESGLVPEEFVRLLRDIEGGLNGLNALDENGDPTTLSPISNDPGSATTPTPGQMEFPTHASKPSGEKHPPVQSTFSTSSKDFLPQKSDDNVSPVSPERS